MQLKCSFCGNEYIIKPFIPLKTDETELFNINKWFFAYCKCDCGEYIIERKRIEAEKINKQENYNNE